MGAKTTKVTKSSVSSRSPSLPKELRIKGLPAEKAEFDGDLRGTAYSMPLSDKGSLTFEFFKSSEANTRYRDRAVLRVRLHEKPRSDSPWIIDIPLYREDPVASVQAIVEAATKSNQPRKGLDQAYQDGRIPVYRFIERAKIEQHLVELAEDPSSIDLSVYEKFLRKHSAGQPKEVTRLLGKLGTDAGDRRKLAAHTKKLLSSFSRSCEVLAEYFSEEGWSERVREIDAQASVPNVLSSSEFVMAPLVQSGVPSADIRYLQSVLWPEPDLRKVVQQLRNV